MTPQGGETRPEGDQPLLSAIAFAATACMLPLLIVVGGFRFETIFAMLLALGLVAAGRDTRPALFGLLVVAVLWLTSDPDPVTPWTLVMAALMLTTHSAVALRSSLPPAATISRDIALRWLRRGAIAFGLTVVTYVAVVGVHELQPSNSELVVALAMGALGVLALVLRYETLRDETP